MSEPADTVVLDVDGTLVDSVYDHVDCWRRAFRDVGVEVPAWRLHRAIGMGGDRLVTEVAGRNVEHAMGDEVRKRHDDHFAERIDGVRALPGAADLVEALRQRVSVVVASSGAEEQTHRLLDVAGVRGLVHATITSEDADASKPDADLVARALEEVGGRTAVVVGDAVWDVEAAHRAGHRAVALRSGGFGRHDLLDAGAVAVYDDPQDLLVHLGELDLA